MDMDDLSRQLDQSIERRFEKPTEVIDLDVMGEEDTAEIQAETSVQQMPDTEIADAEFVESMLNFSEDEAGSEDVTNPLAGIEDRAGEEHTENIQEETNVIDMPDTDVADAESSQDEEAGSKDVSNPMASIEDRAGALLNIFEAKIETELKKKTSPGEVQPRGSIDSHHV
ncbi:hypothetical protein QVD17_00075 [Tagetes erecta]|uniref:Uncharacterized protein n=1 Tax=Tagetes erecta TaxID=13708 RepID=A0AAD8L9G9_TARER|nr:hypothetical protein QVD17_00075 [Tagetes erecta]